MSVNGIDTTPTGSLADFGKAANRSSDSDPMEGSMGKEDFLLLLTTQLRNQDPMNPMKGQEFAAQLAQFTSVEQLVNIKEQLGMQSSQSGMLSQSINSGVAANLIGRNVEAVGNGINLGFEGDAGLSFELQDPAKEVTVTIRNEAGNVVRTIEQTNLEAGDQQLSWDGLKDDGERAGAGAYTFEVEATDAEGNPVAAETFLSGRVDRITFGQDGILLWVGDTKIRMSQVKSVSTAENDSAAGGENGAADGDSSP